MDTGRNTLEPKFDAEQWPIVTLLCTLFAIHISARCASDMKITNEDMTELLLSYAHTGACYVKGS